VDRVEPGTWAETHDFHTDCQILKVGGKPVANFKSADDVRKAMRPRPLDITILRHREEKDIGGVTLTLQKSDGKLGVVILRSEVGKFRIFL